MSPVKKPPQKHRIVHLGFVGEGQPGESPGHATIKIANRFPKMQFFGIDTRPTPEHLPKNVRHIQTDFLVGLESLPHPVQLIQSRMAVGYYGHPGRPRSPKHVNEYTVETLARCHQKLVEGGKLQLMSEGEPEGQLLLLANLQKAGFKIERITIRPMLEREYKSSFWVHKLHKEKGAQGYLITATK